MSDFKMAPAATAYFRKIGGTVRARAASELRDRILTGRLESRTRLDLDQLAAEFGTSRTPVREALLELSYEGLVAVTPRSGITVIGITPEDAVDNFAVLAALSGKAAEWATSRVTPEQLADLRARADAVVAASAHLGQPAPKPAGPSHPELGRHERDVVEANRQFHRAIHLAAGSPRLLTFLRQAVRVVPASYFTLFPEQEAHARDEHAALLDAIERGDGPRARSIAEAHVLDAGQALGDWLRARSS